MRLLLLMFAIALLPDALNAEDRLPFEVPNDSSALPRFAIVETTKGRFTIELFGDETPMSVRNFEYLARRGTYNYVKFHKYMPNFIIQGGDPTGTGKGGPGYSLPPEISAVKHLRGTVGWARPAMKVNPERRSSGSQFYICLSDAPHLDGFYTAFARVVSGMENVEMLREGDRMLTVTFPQKPEQGPPVARPDDPLMNRIERLRK